MTLFHQTAAPLRSPAPTPPGALGAFPRRGAAPWFEQRLNGSQWREQARTIQGDQCHLSGRKSATGPVKGLRGTRKRPGARHWPSSCGSTARGAVPATLAELVACRNLVPVRHWLRMELDLERSPIMISMRKPEAQRLGVMDRNYSYTLGGIAQYHAEIAILCENGYTSTEHAVFDRDDVPMGVVALYRNGIAVKAYEL